MKSWDIRCLFSFFFRLKFRLNVSAVYETDDSNREKRNLCVITNLNKISLILDPFWCKPCTEPCYNLLPKPCSEPYYKPIKSKCYEPCCKSHNYKSTFDSYYKPNPKPYHESFKPCHQYMKGRDDCKGNKFYGFTQALLSKTVNSRLNYNYIS